MAKSNILRFPLKLMPRRVVVSDDERKIEIYPETQEFIVGVSSAKPSARNPSIWRDGGVIVLDLGNCTPDHISIELTPEAALNWGTELISSATECLYEGEDRENGSRRR